MRYIQLDFDGRVIAHGDFEQNPDSEVWLESPWGDDIPEEFDDWLYVDGELVYDARDLPPVPYSPEQVLMALFDTSPEMMDALPDEALNHMAAYMPEWEIGKAYSTGDKVQYQERPYRCLQAHTSQESWAPEIAASLWARILASPDPDQPLEWEQPGSTNPYMTGDVVVHNGVVWVSIVDNNVWEPGVYGWEPR